MGVISPIYSAKIIVSLTDNGYEAIILNADKIMVLSDGKIVDSGTHTELLKNSAKYKKIYEDELIKTEKNS